LECRLCTDGLLLFIKESHDNRAHNYLLRS
jgi:hypothetical protein